MSNVTNLLVALAFVIIGLVFLISYFVTRAKVVRMMKQIISGKSKKSLDDSKAVIETTKRLVWHLGIAYVTIALSLFFEGFSGVITSTVIVVLFAIFGVLLFVYGVVMTAFGVLALYNEKEQKYGRMEKAYLASICKLEDGKNLLVFVPDGSFGKESLLNTQTIDEAVLNKYSINGGRILDFCVVEDAKGLTVGEDYLLYVSALRVKSCGINMTFLTKNGIEALLNENGTKIKKEEKQTEPKVKTDEVKKEPKKAAKMATKKEEKVVKEQKKHPKKAAATKVKTEKKVVKKQTKKATTK